MSADHKNDTLVSVAESVGAALGAVVAKANQAKNALLPEARRVVRQAKSSARKSARKARRAGKSALRTGRKQSAKLRKAVARAGRKTRKSAKR